MTAFDRAEEIAAWLGNLHPHQGPEDSCAIRDRIMSAIHEEKRELSEKLEKAQGEIETLNFHLKDKERDAAALIRLSNGLGERIQNRSRYTNPSNVDTALEHIDFLDLRLRNVTDERDRLKKCLEEVWMGLDEFLGVLRGVIPAESLKMWEGACRKMRSYTEKPSCSCSTTPHYAYCEKAEKRLCSGGQCKFEEGHDGDHVVNLRRRCICPNGTRTAIAHVNGCPAGGG